RVDVESPAMNAARVDMLNRRRFAARWINCISHERVFTPNEDFPAFEIRRGVGAVDAIDDASVRMHVHCAGGLASADLGWVGERFFLEQGFRIQRVAFSLVDAKLVLALKRNVDPR